MSELLRIHGLAVKQELPERFHPSLRKECSLPTHRIAPDLDQAAADHALDGFRDLRLAFMWSSSPGAQEQAIGSSGYRPKRIHISMRMSSRSCG
jgi:hypothetical protein